MDKEQYEKKCNKFYNILIKIEGKIPLGVWQPYMFLQQVIKLLKTFPNPTLEKYIDGIKDSNIKELLIQYKKIQDEIDALREKYDDASNAVDVFFNHI